MGPGRFWEIPAMISSRLPGFQLLHEALVHPLSMEHPLGLAVPMESNTFLSL